MAVIRVLEATVNPGKGAQWREGAKEVKEIVEAEGGNISYLQLLSGGDPSLVMAVSSFENMDSFAAFGDKMNASTKIGEWMQRQAQSEGFPFSTTIGVNVFKDLHAEVGEPSGVPENPSIIFGVRQFLHPGKRAEYVAMVKAIRAELKAVGRPVGNSMECIVGEGGLVTRVIGFESVAAWGTAQQAGFPDSVTNILKEAQANGSLFQSMDSRLMRNITAFI